MSEQGGKQMTPKLPEPMTLDEAATLSPAVWVEQEICVAVAHEQWRRDMEGVRAWLRAQVEGTAEHPYDDPWVDAFTLANEIDAALRAQDAAGVASGAKAAGATVGGTGAGNAKCGCGPESVCAAHEELQKRNADAWLAAHDKPCLHPRLVTHIGADSSMCEDCGAYIPRASHWKPCVGEHIETKDGLWLRLLPDSDETYTLCPGEHRRRHEGGCACGNTHPGAIHLSDTCNGTGWERKV